MVDKKKVRVQSVDRMLDLMEELSNEKYGLTISELSSRVGLQVSTAYNLVNTLKTRDYIHQNLENKKYYLGFKILHLKNTFVDSLDIRKVAVPYMDEIHKEIPETIHLTVRQNMNAVPVYRLESKHSIKVDSAYVGNRGPIYCTASGRAFLLNYSESELNEILSTVDLEPFTEHTITSKEKLIEEIHKSKKRGYTQDFMEYQNSVFCIGAPIYNHMNEIIASISISIPSIRFSPQEKEKVSKLVVRVTNDISKILGYS